MGLGRSGIRQLIFLLAFAVFLEDQAFASFCEDAEPVFLKGQVLKSRLINRIASDTDYLADTDRDGVFDRLDWDMDGDGIANLADHYPFDVFRGKEDVDHDGLPDFVDYETYGLMKDGATVKAARLQQLLLKQYSVIALHDEIPFSETELSLVVEELNRPLLKAFRGSENFRVLFKRTVRGNFPRTRGNFNPFWKTITYFDGSHFFTTFVHELFHVLALDHSVQAQDFSETVGWTTTSSNGSKIFQYSNAGLGERPEVQFSLSEADLAQEYPDWLREIRLASFPSDYSKLGPDEMFAEVAVAAILVNRIESGIRMEIPRSYNLSTFKSSRSHDLLLRFIDLL